MTTFPRKRYISRRYNLYAGLSVSGDSLLTNEVIRNGAIMVRRHSKFSVKDSTRGSTGIMHITDGRGEPDVAG